MTHISIILHFFIMCGKIVAIKYIIYSTCNLLELMRNKLIYLIWGTGVHKGASKEI